MEMTQRHSPSNHIEGNILAEQSVLGAILMDSERIDDIRFLEPRDFSQEQHELIWKVALYLDGIDKPVNVLSVTEIFTRRKRLHEIGGVEYLSQLVAACASTSKAAVVNSAQIVRKNGHRKRLIELSDEIREVASGEHDSDEDMFSAVEDLVTNIRPQESGEMKSMSDTREDYRKHLKSKAEKIYSGFKQFDEWAMLWRGWLYILAGRPSVGKTAKALQLAYGVAKNNPDGGCVLFFSQEMGANELKDRLVSNISGVNYIRLTQKKEELTDKEWERVEKALDTLDKLPIYIQDKASVTIEEVQATVRRFKKRHGKVAAVFVDYLQIMKISQKKNQNRAEAIGNVTSAAKQMARKYKFCFVMLSQMTRESEKREEPMLSDLKESGSIEQDADVVEFLWHNGEKENNTKVIRSYFAKGRNVGENRFKYKFEWWVQRYVELPKKAE
ncbi:replicative DNA helicase [Paenibacillus larvae subsp. larvae DSM 25719]|uniref:replicative DNA helicase n=1 Tax=Paenibacillus larvae TaxID=1464 RepID=UPI0003DD4818|nr:DnaB-like helicase C-terminal domain-containing protein [Paenibacillus larvae]ETK25585.1 replicative DNA helicase [Paenibacillus larvae subsp. larvae DSM 25719]